MKSTFARRMSILLVLAMVLAMLPVGAMAADSTVLYLQPNSNWTQADARFAAYFFVGSTTTWVDMTDADADGVYEVTVPAGDWTHVIFCRMNPGVAANDWSNKWNQTGDIALADVPAGTMCSINAGQWDCGNKYTWVEYSVGGEVTEATAAPKNFDYYVAGSFNGWNECDDNYGMTAADGVYSITFAVEAGSYQMKITNGTWTDAIGNPEGGNITFSCATAGNVTVTYNTADGSYAITGDCLGDAPVVETPVPEGTILNVKGTLPGLDWDADATTGAMTLVDGFYTLTIADVPASEVGADAYAFKIMFNNSWDTAYPESDWTFYLTAACDVTITMNAANQEIGVQAEYMTFDAPTNGEDPVEITSVNVKGSIPGLDWDNTAATGAMTLVDGIYTLTIDSIAASTAGAAAYEFKVLVNGSWDTAYPESNWTFYMSAEGSVTITYNPTTNEVTLTGDNVTYEPIGGEVEKEELVIESVVLVGGAAEGSVLGNFLYGIAWDPAATGMNSLYADEGTKIYSVTYYNVEAGTYEFKFALNGGWDLNYASGLAIESGVTTDAWFNALGNSTFTVGADGSTVTFVLDLTDTVYVGDNAKMSVTIEEPTIVESAAPETLVIGDNAGFVVGTGNYSPVTGKFTATQTGTLVVTPTYMNLFDAWSNTWSEVPAAYIAMQGRTFTLVAGDSAGWPSAYLDVVAGETYDIGVQSWGGVAEFTLTLSMCLEHTFEVDVIAPTCEFEGYTTKYCTTCGYNTIGDYISAIGHSWTYTYTADTHSFECGNCGVSASVANTDSKQMKINSAAPVLGSDIVMLYKVTVPAGFENAYMVFEMNGENYYAFDYTVEESTGRLVFEYPGVTSINMGDNICGTLYATIGDTQVSVQIAEYSLLQYCFNQLKKTSTGATLRTVFSDLLFYGSKAQLFSNYKTDALVSDLAAAKLAELGNSALCLTPSTFTALGEEYNKQVISGDADSRVNLNGVTLVLGSKIIVRYTVTCTDLDAFTYKINVAGVDYTFTGYDLELADASRNRYYLYFDNLYANQLDEVITLSIWEGDTQVSRSLEYSVYTYIWKNQDVADTSIRDLVRAIYNYGQSAKNV